MYKVIKIEDKQIPMMSNGGTLREYRYFFKRDMLTDIIKMETAFKNQKFDDIEIAEILENIAWVLAYKANPKIEPVSEWLEQFKSPFAVISSYEDIQELLSDSNTPTVKPKKNNRMKKKNQ
ncbi:MAG: hypothetical protein ACLTOL_07240 [Thomasclavelia ramosa]